MIHDPDQFIGPPGSRWSSLSSWENEGCTLTSLPHSNQKNMSDMTSSELVLLRIRVIALENLMIAVLTEGSDRQLQIACEMVEYISPRPGFIQHALTIRAGAHMTDIVARADHFRKVQLE